MPAPYAHKTHYEHNTVNPSQLHSSISARTEAVALTSSLKFNSNVTSEQQSIKMARGTFEKIIMRASLIEVTLWSTCSAGLDSSFFSGKNC
jgi:hypothetical protein